jgi:hypothetical protein
VINIAKLTKKEKRNKYNASKKDKNIYKDIKFDSKLELNIYKYLDESDDITILDVQPFFLLEEPFEYFCLEKGKKRKYGKMSYKSDIKIQMKNIDKDIIVEVKGLPTPSYMMRKKLWYRTFGEEYYFLEIRSLKKGKVIFDEIRKRSLE